MRVILSTNYFMFAGSSHLPTWHECPLVGGFDFGLYFKDTIEVSLLAIVPLTILL